jgi:YHS domain-containing protein
MTSFLPNILENKPLFAQQNNQNNTVFYHENNIAIKGTDTVAYFNERKAVQGNSKFSYKWNNVTWLFKNSKNRDLFRRNPIKYAPEYGGFCAWAIAKNEVKTIERDQWLIYKGKLYLFYNKKSKTMWDKDIPGNIAKANQNWPSIQQTLRKK